MQKNLLLIAIYFLQHFSSIAGEGSSVFVLFNFDNASIEYFRFEENSLTPGSTINGSQSGILQPGRYQMFLEARAFADANQFGGNSFFDSAAYSFQADFLLVSPVAESIFQRAGGYASALNVTGMPNEENGFDDPASDLDPNNYAVSASRVGSVNSASGSADLHSAFMLTAGQAIGVHCEFSSAANAFASSTAPAFANTAGRGLSRYEWAFRLDTPTAYAASAAVPEPTAITLFLISASILCLRRRRRTERSLVEYAENNAVA